MRSKPPPELIGVMLATLALMLGLSYVIWTTSATGRAVAQLELRPGTTDPLMGLTVSLRDRGVTARIGPLTLRPSMSPLRGGLEYREPSRPRRFQYAFRVIGVGGRIAHQRRGTFSTWFRALPGSPSVDLGSFDLVEEGRYYLEIEMDGLTTEGTVPNARADAVPDARLVLRAGTGAPIGLVFGVTVAIALTGFGLLARGWLRPRETSVTLVA